MNPEEIRSWEPFLKRVPLFQGLSPQDMTRVAARMQLLSLPKGATLYSQGDEGDALYIVASGQVRVLHPQRGEDVVAALLGRGEVLGEVGLLTGERRTMTIRLDTTCEFLKLMRKDFEEVLRENPSILLHLSRMISRRLVESSRLPPTALPRSSGPSASQLVCLNAALPPDDRLLLALHLSLELLEQTRRRTLLLDLGPDCGAVARVLGLRPEPISEEALRQIDMRDPLTIRTLIQAHPSGLDVLNLPAAVLGGRLYSAIYLFLNFLRDVYDVVLVNLGGDLGDVEKSILVEADWSVAAGGPETKPQFRQLRAELLTLLDPKKMVQAWLGELEAEEPVFDYGPRSMVLPWARGLGRELEKTGSPYEAISAHPKVRAGLGRLARHLGGVKVGLALGTGAALGHSMIGILKVLKREGIPIDVIAGTSMGSILAGLTALGIEPEEIEELASRVDKAWVWENLFWDLTVPRSGLFAGETLLRLLRSYFGSKEFSDLEIPFACVATDIETGEEVTLREGRAAESIRASCGLPLIFTPMHLSGRYLVDGGLVNPVPTKVLTELGADVLLAVSLTMPAGARKNSPRPGPKGRGGLLSTPVTLKNLKELTLPESLKAPSLIDVFFQMIYTMEYEIAQSRTAPAHVLIQPDLTGFSWTELHRAKELIALGERIAEAYVPQIKSMIPFFADYCRVPLRRAGHWQGG